jgi:hypothetical protein
MILRQFLHPDPVASSKLFGREETGAGALVAPIVKIVSHFQGAFDRAPPMTARNRAIILRQTVAA